MWNSKIGRIIIRLRKENQSAANELESNLNLLNMGIDLNLKKVAGGLVQGNLSVCPVPLCWRIVHSQFVEHGRASGCLPLWWKEVSQQNNLWAVWQILWRYVYEKSDYSIEDISQLEAEIDQVMAASGNGVKPVPKRNDSDSSSESSSDSESSDKPTSSRLQPVVMPEDEYNEVMKRIESERSNNDAENKEASRPVLGPQLPSSLTQNVKEYEEESSGIWLRRWRW